MNGAGDLAFTDARLTGRRVLHEPDPTRDPQQRSSSQPAGAWIVPSPVLHGRGAKRSPDGPSVQTPPALRPQSSVRASDRARGRRARDARRRAPPARRYSASGRAPAARRSGSSGAAADRPRGTPRRCRPPRRRAPRTRRTRRPGRPSTPSALDDADSFQPIRLPCHVRRAVSVRAIISARAPLNASSPSSASASWSLLQPSADRLRDELAHPVARRLAHRRRSVRRRAPPPTRPPSRSPARASGRGPRAPTCVSPARAPSFAIALICGSTWWLQRS
jgi:hypothetical protein